MKDLKVSPGNLSNKPRINKRFYIILICLSISTVFWLLLALSHDYYDELSFPVKYVNLPWKKVVMNDLPSKITVQFKTTGFKIISFGFQKDQEPVEVDVAGSMKNISINSDVLSLATQSFLTDFSKELGKEVTITGFQPDSIVFNFSNLVSKKIPVILSLQAVFEKQYDSTGGPVINPPEVMVSGPPSVVDSLKNIQTEIVRLDNLKSTVKKKVKLIGNRLLSYEINEIEFTMPVEKFTEGSVEVEIHPVNVDAGFSLKTFPDKVKVRYLVALSNYNKADVSMFDAVVDAGNLKEHHISKLDVKLMTSPSYVHITILEPEKVDYILRKK